MKSSSNAATLLRALYKKPALVSLDYAESAIEALENKELNFFGSELEGGVKPISLYDVSADEAMPEEPQRRKRAAILEIEGALTYKRQLSHSSLSSYAGIKDAIKNLATDDKYSTWVLDLSTPGGMAYQCFETARFIRDTADRHGKRLIAYVDGQACSAGYALASVAHEIISNPMSDVGSIGVVVAINNELPKEIADGKQILFITSAKDKVPFDKKGNIKQEKIDKIQEDVNKISLQFAEHVSTYRDMSTEDVLKLNADSFNADKALELGLVDKLMEKEDFFSYLSSILKTEDNTTSEESKNLSDQNVTLQELQTQLKNLEATNKQLAGVNKELSDKNEKMSTVLSKIAEEQATAKYKQLVAKLQSFSFIEDSEAMAKALSNIDEADKGLVMSAFDAASKELVEKREKEAAATDSDDIMFESLALNAGEELADMSDLSSAIDQLLTNKVEDKGDAK